MRLAIARMSVCTHLLFAGLGFVPSQWLQGAEQEGVQAIADEAQALLTGLEDLTVASEVDWDLALTEDGYVEFKDISIWKEVAPHYAAGYDAEKKLLAMFDLSYQNPMSRAALGRAVLGTLGVGDVNLRTVISLLIDYVKKQQSKQTAFMAPEHSRIIDFILKNKNRILMTLAKIAKAVGAPVLSLGDGWWQKVQWTGPRLKQEEPEAFDLAEIDYDSLLNDKQKEEFSQGLEKLHRLFQMTTGEAASFAKDEPFLARFTYEKSDKAYALKFKVGRRPQASKQASKVIDFIQYQNKLESALFRKLYKQALSQIVSAIPEPTVSKLLGYAISRWFYLYEQQERFHRYKALELVNLAATGQSSSMEFLAPDELVRAGVFIYSHDASFESLLAKKRDEAYWRQTLSQEKEGLEQNLAWSKIHKVTLEPIGSSFFKGQHDSKSMLMMFGDSRKLSKAPFIAIDYAAPHAVRIQRNLAFTLRDLLPAVKLPIPYASRLIARLFEIFVIADMEKAMGMEARLAAYLEMQAPQTFSRELELIYDQRLNPFELNRQEEKRFITRAREIF